jgi:hypothetical protein
MRCFMLKHRTYVTSLYKLQKYVLQNHVSIFAKSLILYFQYNIESVYFFYSNPVHKIDNVVYGGVEV